MKINAVLTDGDGQKDKRQYTPQEAMALIKSFLTSGATIIIESDGGKVELVVAHNEK